MEINRRHYFRSGLRVYIRARSRAQLRTGSCGDLLSHTLQLLFIRISWDGEPPGYAENPDNWRLL
jgi:hypothetical protein